MKIYRLMTVAALMAITAMPLHAASKPIVEITGPVKTSMTMTADNDYMITGEVHVLSGVTLGVEDGVTILIRNGNQNRSVGKTFGKKSGLVFDTGSSLAAKNISFKACDDVGTPVSVADNAGLFLMGSSALWQQGQLLVNFATRASSFVADSISTDYLGRLEPVKTRLSPVYPGINIIGMNVSEWNVGAVASAHAASYGMRVDRSVIRIDSLNISDSGAAGIRLFDTRLDIVKTLGISNNSALPKVQLFDFGQIRAIEKGPSRMRMFPGASVAVNGLINPWVSVLSENMPAVKTGVAASGYSYSGVLGANQTYITSTYISSF